MQKLFGDLDRPSRAQTVHNCRNAQSYECFVHDEGGGALRKISDRESIGRREREEIRTKSCIGAIAFFTILCHAASYDSIQLSGEIHLMSGEHHRFFRKDSGEEFSRILPFEGWFARE